MATVLLHKKNLFHNLEIISKTNPNILAVIKDNAYGHGIISFSKMLKEWGIERVCVRNIQEAEAIRPFFKEIVVFYPHTGRGAKNFSYCINSLKQLKKNRHPYIHIKIDTGMHRNGIMPEEIEKALEISFEKGFEIKGVFSHFCCADETGCDVFIQYERFKKIKSIIEDVFEKRSLPRPYFHIANSHALKKLPDTFDYVRPGIAMYGGIEGYKPVMELRADVISTRKLEKGQGCGYNKMYMSETDIEITTVDVGYGDGIAYFKNGCRLKDAEALGKISMDSMILKGRFEKEVVVFDDVKEFVKNFDTITYDILVKISPRIKRKIV